MAHLSSEEAGGILASWLAAIFEHPREYLDHRLEVTMAATFYPQFGAEGERAGRAIFGAQKIVSIATFRHPFEFSERPGYSVVRRILTSSAESVLCRPWPYLAIALAVWLFGWWRRSEESQIAGSFASSGLLSVVPLFVIAPSTDFRYAVWLVASALVALVLTVLSEIRTRPRR